MNDREELLARLEASQKACFDAGQHIAAMDIQTARAELSRLAVKPGPSEAEAKREKLIEGLPSPPSHLLFYGLADAFHLSIKIRYAAGGSINHEFARNDIEEIRGALHPARGQIK